MPIDPLKFRDERRYIDRLKDARTKTNLDDAVKVGYGKLDGLPVTVAVQDFDFMGGSLGMAAGEAVINGLETAVEQRHALHHVRGLRRRAHAGRHPVADAAAAHHRRGARCCARRGKPYIVVLTNPTTGGVTASYAMLGDVHIAEPGALIGFAGPRVIEQTIREKLPAGFQRAEYLKDTAWSTWWCTAISCGRMLSSLLPHPDEGRRRSKTRPTPAGTGARLSVRDCCAADERR